MTFRAALHFVEVVEAAGAEEHEGEEQEVVGGVDQDAGGERAGVEADGAEDEADEDQQEKGPEGIAGLRAVHEGERNAGEDGADDHGGYGPLRVAEFVDRASAAPVKCSMIQS